MSTRGLALTSALLTVLGALILGGQGFGALTPGAQGWLAVLPWACFGLAGGLALGILVSQAARDPLLPRRLAGLVLVAPLFAVGYGVGRMLWGKSVSWVKLLELGGLSLLVLATFALTSLCLRER
ncbi:MAG: hypothetical protein ACK42L_00045 [Thermoanaerobaculum sp.]